MKLNSKKIIVQKSAADLCDYLVDVRNFESLMPDNITKFEVLNERAFLFALKGMPEIGLEVKEVHAPNQVILGAISDKFPFTLTGNIEELTDHSSHIELLFEGKFSGMMGMMVKGPLTKFLDTLSTNLEKA